MKSKQAAGWKSRQKTTVMNCGKLTDVVIWKSTETDSFHIRCQVKEMGQQEVVLFESILPFDEAREAYMAMATDALVEVVSPPNPGRQIVGIIDEGDDPV